ncbi:MAG: HAD hydrolase-like protein, partial [Bdellovibrionales bacterium]|nr:HAD hydrolase-like protein [Bdellovibrionales bacterium]
HILATSKPHVYARRILEHFKVDHLFRAIHGSELDGANSVKTELLPYILQKESLASTDGFMIGDRKHDVLGAKSVHMKSIGVLWGYGSREELTTNGADHIVETAGELLKIVE